jgi:hypothetical protein
MSDYNEKVPKGYINENQFYVIPSVVDVDHFISCPYEDCKKNIIPLSPHDLHTTHKTCYWTCFHCNRYYSMYKCRNCNHIVALLGKLRETTCECECCNTEHLTRDWCLNEYPKKHKE